MITVEAARDRARTKLGRSMPEWVAEPQMEPVLTIALKPPTERQVLLDQNVSVEWATGWRLLEQKDQVSGIHVEWESRSWSRVGQQRVPVRVHFRAPDDVAQFVGGEAAHRWRRMSDRAQKIRIALDIGTVLRPLLSQRGNRILALSDAAFTQVLGATMWLRDHPQNLMRPRQLPIRGVDSKWFTEHRVLVQSLLNAAGFSEAITVLDAETRIRFRILDPSLRPGGLGDVTAPASEVRGFTVSPSVVFVVENLETLLSLPDFPGAVAIHGSGYAVDLVSHITWVKQARVIYWGDLDSHGFAILSKLRSHLFDVTSVLMDEKTLLDHRDMWVGEPKPHRGRFSKLTLPEETTLARIRDEGDVRLEQERIPWEAALTQLMRSYDHAMEHSSVRDRPREGREA
ncbi:Wadjet anti-phage system protein JetD domain-containing protein [Citricoccus muralis]|uniref:DUF2220 family protein n=1 Tax=Citricoccus muralis TaxID=169134 RepID=A0ABY8H5F7_9MICC|nr:DUF3322 and DUF2220 domain-containing protein [Citricoccus muralis]WFP16374.1 DUF2220 family protein [Citricoccus muralis]